VIIIGRKELFMEAQMSYGLSIFAVRDKYPLKVEAVLASSHIPLPIISPLFAVWARD
jgi:hypothetical protein